MGRKDAMPYPREYVLELLLRVDVVAVVRPFVHLRTKEGKRGYIGLCPFSAERTPSFVVLPDKQFYHCHGCGATGNAIGFLMDKQGMSYPEAVMYLANRYKFYPKQWWTKKKRDNRRTK
jgi:DNA primase